MSRKTVEWRKRARQAGEESVHLLLPHRATGRGRFRCMELDDVTLERAFGNVCCRPMRDEKAARILKLIQAAAKFTPAKKGWR